MNAGKSRIALLKEKSAVVNDILDIAKEESKVSDQEKNIEVQTDMGSKDAEEKPVVPESASPEKPTAALDEEKMDEYVNLLVKKIQESGDPRILKKHPQYKGVRYKRSYQYEEHLYEWLLKVNSDKGVDITFMVNEAVRAYLKKEYPECEPEIKS
jgi:hypothetical protein